METKCPLIRDWLNRLWHIYTMILKASLEKNEAELLEWSKLSYMISGKLKCRTPSMQTPMFRRLHMHVSLQMCRIFGEYCVDCFPYLLVHPPSRLTSELQSWTEPHFPDSSADVPWMQSWVPPIFCIHDLEGRSEGRSVPCVLSAASLTVFPKAVDVPTPQTQLP